MEGEHFLRRALELARRGGSAVEPNPRVGAVIVHDGTVIGEGWHEYFGGPHAEVNAVRSVSDPRLLASSTLYVTLEPCNHHGKTPPCTELILNSGIPRVVVGMADPNPAMSGKSIEMLRARGVEVITAEDTSPYRDLISHFLVNQQMQRPFMTLKWAQSADGFIAALSSSGHPVRTELSGAEANAFVHRMRAQHSGILIGTRTALIDDPALTTRLAEGRNPTRIIFDENLKLSRHLRIFEPTADVILLNDEKDGKDGHIHFVKLARNSSLTDTVKKLYREYQIGSLLVEGGAATLNLFLQEDLWDELFVIHTPKVLGSGLAAPSLHHSSAEETMYGADRVVKYVR